MTGVILQQLSRRYRDIVAVESLDLEIADKEFVVLLGPSGCGKTTTLNLIAGVDAPTSGHILFDGHPIEHAPPQLGDLRRSGADVHALERATGWEPKTSLADGLAKTLAWARG